MLGADRFVRALREQIRDGRGSAVRLPLAGAGDQFTDSTDALGNLTALRTAVAAQAGLPLAPDGAGPAQPAG